MLGFTVPLDRSPDTHLHCVAEFILLRGDLQCGIDLAPWVKLAVEGSH